jgi:Holliday junction resolvasome RuvABC DNA-binding subunit
LANVADLVSALVNLGFKKGLASELAREAISRAPNAPLEELIRVALAKRGER